MTTLKEQFGKRIKEIRKSKGFTQEQIAERIGIEPPNVSKLEKGAHFPLPENIEKIACALDVSVKDLFDFEHINKREKLIKKIHNFIDNANEKELEILYKFIINLEEYNFN